MDKQTVNHIALWSCVWGIVLGDLLLTLIMVYLSYLTQTGKHKTTADEFDPRYVLIVWLALNAAIIFCWWHWTLPDKILR